MEPGDHHHSLLCPFNSAESTPRTSWHTGDKVQDALCNDNSLQIILGRAQVPVNECNTTDYTQVCPKRCSGAPRWWRNIVFLSKERSPPFDEGTTNTKSFLLTPRVLVINAGLGVTLNSGLTDTGPHHVAAQSTARQK